MEAIVFVLVAIMIIIIISICLWYAYEYDCYIHDDESEICEDKRQQQIDNLELAIQGIKNIAEPTPIELFGVTVYYRGNDLLFYDSESMYCEVHFDSGEIGIYEGYSSSMIVQSGFEEIGKI